MTIDLLESKLFIYFYLSNIADYILLSDRLDLSGKISFDGVSENYRYLNRQMFIFLKVHKLAK